jgi:hypothetical protein
VYFSNNWFKSREFPKRTAAWIRETGSVPFIRLMLRSGLEERQPETLFTLEAILAGKFDADLKRWGRSARDFGSPLLVEWGTEMNGEWFPWNGRWNGAVGPARFAAAYRRIVDAIRSQGAGNITWVFHADAQDDPAADGNRFERYYPGDAYVDWIGVSVYGPQSPVDPEAAGFRERMDAFYARARKLAPAKPIAVLEFGCAAGHKAVLPEAWAGAALSDLLAGRWPKVAGFSWWNERWENDGERGHDTTMRLQDIPGLAQVFRKRLAEAGETVLERPIGAAAETRAKAPRP